jgi:hypothetical protein
MIHTKEIKDARGTLVALEGLPFPVKRVFWLRDIKGERGGHAHRKTRQYAICVQGTCSIYLTENGVETRHDLAAKAKHVPHTGILLEPHHWVRITHCSQNCILLILASEAYNEKEYIRDYEEYKKIHGA